MNRYACTLGIITVACGLGSCSRTAADYAARGDKFSSAGNLVEAEINYRKAIQANSKFGPSYFGLAKCLAGEGKHVEAYQPLLTAASLLPDNRDVREALAEAAAYLYLADPRRPKNLYDKLRGIAAMELSKDPASYIGLRVEGVLALDEKRPKDAIRAFQQASRAQPWHPEVLLGLSQAFFEDGQFQAGELLARELIDRDKTFLPIYDVLYVQYAAANRVADAEHALQLKVQNNPRNADAVLQLATHHLRAKDPVKVKSDLQLLLDHPSDFPLAGQQAGDFYFAAGQPALALEQYEAGAAAHPGQDVLYRKRIAKALAALGRRELALKTLDQILAANHEDAESRTLRANLCVEDGSPARIEQAVGELRSLTKTDGANPDLRLALGHALLREKNLDAAASEFSEAIRLRPDLFAARFALAQIAWSQGKYDILARHAAAILTHDPGNPRAELMEAAGKIGTREYENARRELRRLQAKFPEDPNVQLQLGLLAFAEKKYGDAERIFRGIKVPGPRPAIGLAEVYFAEARTQKALDVLKAELTRSPSSREVRAVLATAAGRLGDYSLAIEQYRGLLSLEPGSVQAEVGLGEVYRLKGDLDSAIRVLKNSIEEHPKSPAPLVMLAYTFEASGRLNEAKQFYRRALDLSPDPAVMNNLANLMAESGENLDEALALVQTAMRKVQHQSVLSDTLGLIYCKKGMNESALRYFAIAVKQNPDNAVFRYHFGISLLDTGDKKGAGVQLSEALRHSPDGETDQKIRQALVKVE